MSPLKLHCSLCDKIIDPDAQPKKHSGVGGDAVSKFFFTDLLFTMEEFTFAVTVTYPSHLDICYECFMRVLEHHVPLKEGE